jgi:hypothetical protein
MGNQISLSAINPNGKHNYDKIKVLCDKALCPDLRDSAQLGVSWNDSPLTNLPVCQDTIALTVSGPSLEQVKNATLTAKVGDKTHTRAAARRILNPDTQSMQLTFDSFKPATDFAALQSVNLMLDPIGFAKTIPVSCKPKKKETVNEKDETKDTAKKP